MNLKTILIGAAVLLGYQSTQAQQLPETNLYPFNKYQINPGYTGFNKCLEAYGSRLTQWTGVEGAPVTTYFSAHAGLGDNMGLGAGVVLDKASFINRLSARLSYSYRVKFGRDHDIRFGIAGGMYQVQVDAGSAIVDDVDDIVVSGGAQSAMTFDSEFGIWYRLKGLELGVSIPQIFETRAKLDFQDLDGFNSSRHFVAYAGYNAELGDKWNLEPSVLYKTVRSNLSQVDVNAMVTYNNLISVGAGYRTHVGVLARLGIRIKDMFILGYAYELPGSGISSLSTGSHEVMLGFKFCGKSKPVIDEVAEEPMVEEIVEEEVVESTPEPAPVEAEPEPVEEAEEVEEVEEVEAPAPPPPPVVKEVDQSVFDVKVNFPLNDAANYDFESNKDLNKMAEALKDNPNWRLDIIGHACDLGSAETNARISKQRANKVKKYLLSKGVSEKQLNAYGVSDSKPLVPNTSEANRLQNRRVEFKLIK